MVGSFFLTEGEVELDEEDDYNYTDINVRTKRLLYVI